jgi:hypothetical protein
MFMKLNSFPLKATKLFFQFTQFDTINKYNKPSFATMFQRALLNTYITTRFGLNPSHHQVLSYKEY